MFHLISGLLQRNKKSSVNERGASTVEWVGIAAVTVAIVGSIILALHGGAGAQIGEAVSSIMSQIAFSFDGTGGTGGSVPGGVPGTGHADTGVPSSGSAQTGRSDTGVSPWDSPDALGPSMGIPQAVASRFGQSEKGGAEAGFDWKSLLGFGRVFNDLVRGKFVAGSGAISPILHVASNFVVGEMRDYLKGAAYLIKSLKAGADAVDKLAGWGNLQNSSTAFSALKWTRFRQWTKPFANVVARHPWLVKVGAVFSLIEGVITMGSGIKELRRGKSVDGLADIGAGFAMSALGLAGLGVITLSAPVTAFAFGGVAIFTAIRYRREIGTFLKGTANNIKAVAKEAFRGIRNAFAW